MTWFFAVIVVAVMGGIAVVAAGRGGSMAESFDDRPDARVPVDGPLTRQDLRRVRFSTALRGYRMSEVDALLDRLASELEPRRDVDQPGPVRDAHPHRADRRHRRARGRGLGLRHRLAAPGGVDPADPGRERRRGRAVWVAGSGPGAASARSASGTR